MTPVRVPITVDRAPSMRSCGSIGFVRVRGPRAGTGWDTRSEDAPVDASAPSGPAGYRPSPSCVAPALPKASDRNDRRHHPRRNNDVALP